MRIGAVSFAPYIYNTNVVSGKSLSKVASIGNDLLSSKTDFSSLADERLNENPLQKGQTFNFADILDRQMYAGKMNASRIMKSGEEAVDFEEAGELQLEEYELKDSGSEKTEFDAAWQEIEEGQAEAVDDFKPVNRMEEIYQMHSERNLFQMRRAAEAYQMNMFI